MTEGRTMRTETCLNCGERVTQPIGRGRPRLYCSTDCGAAHRLLRSQSSGTVVSVATSAGQIDVWVSPAGRSVRVYRDGLEVNS